MKKYSIVRMGNEYIVKVDEQGILKVSGRRQAAKLVSLAADLLERERALPVVETPSIACDRSEVS
jgi:hypothetical protein